MSKNIPGSRYSLARGASDEHSNYSVDDVRMRLKTELKDIKGQLNYWGQEHNRLQHLKPFTKQMKNRVNKCRQKTRDLHRRKLHIRNEFDRLYSFESLFLSHAEAILTPEQFEFIETKAKANYSALKEDVVISDEVPA